MSATQDDSQMRDIESPYREGKAHLEAQRYTDALAALRQARSTYAGHYKDTDALIVEAQIAMQKENWHARSTATAKKGCFLTGALALFSILFLTACSAAPASPGGSAAQLAPQQRSNMYKAAPPLTIDVNRTYVATIKTAKGDIAVDLYPKDAPQTVNNFIFLAREGFYNNLTFHRVESGFVIQGGDPLGTGTGGPGYTIPAEIKARHTKSAIAMARLPDEMNPRRESSGSQFYITLEPQPALDGQYTVFGQVTRGMDVVGKIAIGDVIQTVTIEEK